MISGIMDAYLVEYVLGRLGSFGALTWDND